MYLGSHLPLKAVHPSGSGTACAAFCRPRTEEFSRELPLIDQEVEDDGEHHGAQAVQHGVLFQKHGGQADGDCRYRGDGTDPPMSLGDFAVPPGQVHAERSKDVDAGKHVGGGVCLIEGDDPSGKHIFLGIHRGPHGLSVGEQGADGQTDGHADEQKGRHPVEFALGPPEQEKGNGAGHEEEPEEIVFAIFSSLVL